MIVNEINTMPGFTPVSMFPLMWATAGLDYPALIDRLLQLALQPAHRPALTAPTRCSAAAVAALRRWPDDRASRAR